MMPAVSNGKSFWGTVLRHPLQMLSVFNRRNIHNFFAITKESGLRVSLSNMKRVLSNSASDINRVNVLTETQTNGTSTRPITVPSFQEPLVSVIIPVHNQFMYTYRCIESVVSTSEGIPYEIILADDCSTDETQKIEDYIEGLRIVKNETSLGFTLNCNEAAKHAKGKFIALLNNDTIVQDHWMQRLVETFDIGDDIGIVGSKLIYPDGILQEAGGIIWADGSAWNYGKGMNPNLPEFEYLKEADYVSAASLMIPRSLWEELGGFDERYAPAYCEDSDLAFSARSKGFKVLYQPKSVVVHFEGISNGKSHRNVVKAHQLTNIQKFSEKWGLELSDAKSVGKDVFLSRDRTTGKKHILYIDEHITNPSEDEYSQHVSQSIIDCKNGSNAVIMIPDDYLHSDYADMYQIRGIEVLYGAEHRINQKKWLRSVLKYIDYVVICRPYLVKKYSKMVPISKLRVLDIKNFMVTFKTAEDFK